jgi:hypothetical protein
MGASLILLTELAESRFPLRESIVLVDGFLGIADDVDEYLIREIGEPVHEVLENASDHILHELRIGVCVNDDLSLVRPLQELERG